MVQNERVITLAIKQTGDRNSTRKLVVDAFFDELPGTGNGNLASRYRYNVETLEGGRFVYLTRPAWLKAGFDFVIHVEGGIFRNGKDNPAHQDIANDLRAKAGEDPASYRRLHEALVRVYACEDPEDILPEYAGLHFEAGMSVDTVLKVVKWLFIEQDIRYWNYSGRGMFQLGVIQEVSRFLENG